MSTVFTNIVDNLALFVYNKITPAEFEQFEREWILYILKEYRYGQAFCEHFGIGNATPLYHFKDETISRRWILDNYLQQ
jgi:hypothetical protein